MSLTLVVQQIHWSFPISQIVCTCLWPNRLTIIGERCAHQVLHFHLHKKKYFQNFHFWKYLNQNPTFKDIKNKPEDIIQLLKILVIIIGQLVVVLIFWNRLKPIISLKMELKKWFWQGGQKKGWYVFAYFPIPFSFTESQW